MKDFNRLESALLSSNESFKGKMASFVNNMGKVIAVIAAAVAALITFTDITMSTLSAETFVPSLIAILICSYVIYFSLEDAGEDLGKSSEEYRSAYKKYSEQREKCGGEDIEDMRAFCKIYAKEELQFRKSRLMLTYGISKEELDAYERGENLPRHKRRGCKKIARQRCAALTPQLLLSRGRWHKRSELSNPERGKVPMLLVKILPSTICMVLTVSIMLNVKEDMTVSDIINGILKLSALPMIGFKGYSAGYGYAKGSLSLWIETKANILEKFQSRRMELKELMRKGEAEKADAPAHIPLAEADFCEGKICNPSPAEQAPCASDAVIKEYTENPTADSPAVA